MPSSSPVRISLAAVLAAAMLSAADIPRATVSVVEILGARAAIPLETRAGEKLDAGRVTDDVKALWRSGRFSDIRVETVPDGESVRVRFVAKLKSIVRVDRVEVKPPTPGVNLQLPPAAELDAAEAQRIAARVRKQLEDSGYRDARVKPELRAKGPGKADLLLRVDKGRAVDVQNVRIFGQLGGVKESEARKALRATRSRRILPGIPGIWGGWRLLAGYNPDAVQSDAASLRLFFISRGFFDSRVRVDSVKIDGGKATVGFAVESGPRYAIRRFRLAGAGGIQDLPAESDAGFPLARACRALQAERRDAERAGVLDFQARIAIHDLPGPLVFSGGETRRWTDLTASVRRGPAYRVGRIEFRGNRTVDDLTIRRSFLLDEGRPLDEMLLRKTQARLNRMGLFEPLGESSVVVNTPPGSDRADIIVRLQERKMRHWFISGPAGPVSFAGPLEFAIGSRLPPWGRGIFELSTYAASLNFMLFAKPVASLLPFLPNKRFLMLVTIQRPLLPGQRFLSGFNVAPQLGWQGVLAGYGASQARSLLSPLFQSDRAFTPALPVTIGHEGSEPPEGVAEGMISCEAQKTRMDRVKQVAGTATNLVFSLLPF